MDLNKIEQTCQKWKEQLLGNQWVENDEKIHLNGDIMAVLAKIARTAIEALAEVRAELPPARMQQGALAELSHELTQAGLITSPAES